MELKIAHQPPLIVWHLLFEKVGQFFYLSFSLIDEEAGLRCPGFVDKGFFPVEGHPRGQRNIYFMIGESMLFFKMFLRARVTE